jgi:hypothetical protein
LPDLYIPKGYISKFTVVPSSEEAANLWAFAKALCPRVCKLIALWSIPTMMSPQMSERAEREAKRLNPHTPEWKLRPHADAARARRVELRQAMVQRLLVADIPERVRRALARGGYDVTGYGPDGQLVNLSPRDLAGLQPDLYGSRLAGDGLVYTRVRVVRSSDAASAVATRPGSVKTTSAVSQKSQRARRRRSFREQLIDALVQIHRGGTDIINRERGELHRLALDKAGLGRNGPGSSRPTFERALAAALDQIGAR